jgi:hypothetical protein
MNALQAIALILAVQYGRFGSTPTLRRESKTRTKDDSLDTGNELRAAIADPEDTVDGEAYIALAEGKPFGRYDGTIKLDGRSHGRRSVNVRATKSQLGEQCVLGCERPLPLAFRRFYADRRTVSFGIPLVLDVAPDWCLHRLAGPPPPVMRRAPATRVGRRVQSSCLQRIDTPILLIQLVIGCLGGTPTAGSAGHLVKITASLPAKIPTVHAISISISMSIDEHSATISATWRNPRASRGPRALPR